MKTAAKLCVVAEATILYVVYKKHNVDVNFTGVAVSRATCALIKLSNIFVNKPTDIIS